MGKENSENIHNLKNFLKIGLISMGSIAAGTLAITKILSQDKNQNRALRKLFSPGSVID